MVRPVEFDHEEVAMRKPLRVLGLILFVTGALALPSIAAADHDARPSNDLHALGHSRNPASFFNPTPEAPATNINSDLAFWGDRAYQGNYNGFRIIDISTPRQPELVFRQDNCIGNQGDVVVWGDILIRSWNSPAGSGSSATLSCDGVPVPPGWEGVHVFDISDEHNPEVVAMVQTRCGSHTATGVPDVENNRLLVYSSSSAHSDEDPNPPATCDWFDLIEVPLDAPEGAALLKEVPSMHTCHDIGVILGDVLKAACAGGEGFRVFSLGGPDGGALDDPKQLYHVEEPGVTVGHSAGWTWDGEVIIFGWEPGGGAAAECEATDDPLKKSMLFYDADTGQKLGMWTLPRPQGPTENCTIHNYNTLPVRSGKYVAISGNYQAGTWVTVFTNPSRPRAEGWSDPEPITPADLGGAWSSYFYNGFIYESSINEGLNVFRISKKREREELQRGLIHLDHLNPQTQEFSL